MQEFKGLEVEVFFKINIFLVSSSVLVCLRTEGAKTVAANL